MTASDPRSVLVVGAGPVGLTMACELVRRGVAVRLIDERAAPMTESRAIVVQARSLEMWERLGIVEAALAAGQKAVAFEFHENERQVARFELEHVDSPYPFSLMLSQTDTERLLAERLAALGGGIERNVALVDLAQDDESVTARLRHADGTIETARVGWVVGADGGHSTVREQTGQQLEGSFKGERFVLADVEVETDLDRACVHVWFPPKGGGPLLAFPMVGTRMRVIAEVAPDTPVGTSPPMDQVQALVDERGGHLTLRSTHWTNVFEIHHAQVPRYRVGRAFLAGDAAHVHSPAAGQGMNTGMQDAFNLGWKLAAVVAGNDPVLLDSYHFERHPVAAQVIEDTTRLTHLGTISSRPERAIRDALMELVSGIRPISEKIAAVTEETTVSYTRSPIVERAHSHHRGGPRPGEAAPNVDLADGTALHALLATCAGHAVLRVAATSASESEPPAGAPEGTRLLLVSDADVTVAGYERVLVDPDRRIARRYGLGADGGTVIVRPDGYLGSIQPGARAVDPYFRLLEGAPRPGG